MRDYILRRIAFWKNELTKPISVHENQTIVAIIFELRSALVYGEDEKGE